MDNSMLPALDPEVMMLKGNKDDGYEYRRRRQEDWLENYTMYRDNIIVNRLSQRQTVNLPLMKQHIRTLLKDVDDMPVLYYENLDNNKDAEVLKNEYWKIVVKENNLEVQDIIDKKQVFLFGRSFMQIQVVDGKIVFTVIDPQDILLSRFTDPHNIHTSRFLIHTHIFVPLSVLEKNPNYDQEKVRELKIWYGTTQGIIKASDNVQMMQEKNKKLQQMGVTNLDSPILGETYVELSNHFVWREDENGNSQIWLHVEAENLKQLMKKSLESIMGKTVGDFWQKHYPYSSWADDVEKQDVWSDAVADIIRPNNKVINTFYSQKVENRMLKNFNMNVYDATKVPEGFNPQTFVPMPWGWYGVPGKPGEVWAQMPVADLDDTFEDIQFLITMTEKSTGATSTEQGVQSQRQVTLGEVQLALGEAKERIKGMSKFYTPAWEERGEMFVKLIEGSADKIDAVKIYKEGRNTGDIYSREVSPTDWMTKSGYRCKVWSQDEKKTQDEQQLTVLSAVRANMPGNPKLEDIFKRKLLEMADLPPDDINAIMEVEMQRQKAMASMGATPLDQATGQPVQQQTPPPFQLNPGGAPTN